MIARRLLGLAVAVLAVLAVVPAPGAPVPVDVAEAADTRQFDPGNIITDQLFFDGGAMTAAEVQRFLEVKNPDCVAGVDAKGTRTPCLKHYRQTTWTRAADASCPGRYTGATGETAAAIIAKVGRACGVSQRVLLVLLQKEQSLVTASGSSLYPSRYQKATGYACPDTAPCNAEYYGFFNQVYSAASRYKYYAANPTRFNYRAGRANDILFHPDRDCGSSSVTIRNQATAGLYIYTPYQPNAAALAAGKGTGDRCSAYGNRNFWIFFTDWFGSTQTPGASALTDRYVASGGAGGPLGAVTTAVTCGLRDGGCFQHYTGGSIYWSPATGARIVLTSPVRTRWASSSWERGTLGYPTSDVRRTPDGLGWFGHFQGGSVYWSQPTGAWIVSGVIRSRWASLGWERSASLGYPRTDVRPTPGGGGQYADFERGSLYWSAATGARRVAGPVKAAWGNAGGEQGWLGFPTSDVALTGDGRAHIGHFAGGSVFVVDGTVRLLPLPFAQAWQRTGATRSPLGYPTSGVSAQPDGGRSVAFERGTVYVAADGTAAALHGAVEDAYDAASGPAGDLGLPLTDVTATADGRAEFAHFTGGSIYVVDSTPRIVPGAIGSAWQRAGRHEGPLGYPVGDVTATAGGREMRFAGGTVHQQDGAPSAFALHGPVGTAHTAAGGVSGRLGHPTTDVRTAADGGGRFAHFQRGSVYWSASTGARVLTGAVRTAWAAAGSERGLGYPTTSVAPTPDGVGEFAHFQRGSVYWTPSTGARALSGAIRTAWAAAGSEGSIGYPVTDVRTTPDGVGRFAHFQRGSIYWTSGTGARLVSGPIRDRWAATGWERGLGYPTSDVRSTPDRIGAYAHFQRGSVYWTSSTGARKVAGAVKTAWGRTGWERGPLGYPTGELRRITGGSRQDFQGGWIVVSGSTGRATVTVR